MARIKTTIRTERIGEVYLSEHDLAVLISNALKGNAPKITVDNLDWDISQGTLVNGVHVRWSEQDEAREVEKEI